MFIFYLYLSALLDKDVLEPGSSKQVDSKSKEKQDESTESNDLWSKPVKETEEKSRSVRAFWVTLVILLLVTWFLHLHDPGIPA